jgi:hypothetical protein
MTVSASYRKRRDDVISGRVRESPLKGKIDHARLPHTAAGTLTGMRIRLAEDQDPVGEFGPHGQYEAFGEAVRPRTARRDLDHLDTGVRHERVERRRELPGPVADEEPEPVDVFAEVHHQVAACWVVQGSSGCPVTPSTCR